jgi:Na+/proline symporter
MVLGLIDWSIIAGVFVISLFIGLWTSRKAGRSSADFFLSGRNMPWWLLGISMVATTFSADTPNLVTDIVRKNGIAGNWAWWAFLLTGMLTVFVYARLWRRSGVQTDLEFYEIRYGGKPAAFLRGFRALYLGVFFNIIIMASVSLAMIKIGSIMLGLSPVNTILIASVVTVIYSSLGGLRGVIITDFFQFMLAMVGSVGAAYIILQLPEIGGLEQLLKHPGVNEKLDFLPDFNDSSTLIPLLIIPIAVQWWSVWYPGSEPGGGGYIAQRMLSAKDEKNALGATLLFNVAHYALRPWPWIIIALSSIIVFPDLASLSAAFPNVPSGTINDDLAYPAMLTYLPAGMLGLVIASLIAAYMSTISTHLNWGSSYVVNDFYVRFINPSASDRRQVAVGRVSTVLMMAISAVFALMLTNALQAFNILLQIGAGTGLIFILRWFWWRINAYTEITGMIVSFLVALWFEVLGPMMGYSIPEGHWRLLIGIGITTAAWLLVTFLTQPEKDSVLRRFYELVGPASLGWKPVLDRNPDMKEEKGQLPFEILLMLIGCATVYAALFATGYWMYGNQSAAIVASALAIAGTLFLLMSTKKLRFQ